MNRLILLVAIISFIGCNNTETSDQEQTTSEEEVSVPTNANVNVDELAQTTCDCVKKLTEERDLIAKYREEGNKAEALKLITSSKGTQREAFECSKPHIESIRYDQGKWKDFEKKMLSICPQGGTALLIMHDIHYKE